MIQIAAGEFPFKRPSDSLKVAFKLPKGMGQLVQRLKVVWRQNLSLNNREVDFDLIEPTAVNGSMDQLQTRIPLLKPLHTGQAPVGGTVVDDPEYSAGLGIGWLGHDPINQLIKGLNPTTGPTLPKDPGVMNIHGRQIGDGSPPLILVFDLHGLAGLGWLAGMDASAGLDAGLFIGGKHKFIRLQGLALPGPRIEVQQSSGFGGEVRIAREDPTAVKPRSDGILMEPAPKRRLTDLGDQAGLADLLGQFGEAPAREGQAKLFGQFASQGFNLHDQFWGEKPGGGPGGGVLPTRASAPGRSACAIG